MNFNIRNNIMRSGIHDITDGEQHRILVLRVRTYYAGIIDEPYEVLSFTMNTDGVQIFESSNESVWPIFLVMDQLYRKRRFVSHKICTFALWQGKGKLPVKGACKLLQAEFDRMNGEGK